MAFLRKVSKNAHLGISINNLQPDYNKSVIEHKHYSELLESFFNKENVYTLDDSDSYPDCCFVEDVIVSIGETIVINNSGAESRRGEKDEFIKFFKNNNIGKKIIEMTEEDGTLDGGDVLFIKEFGEIFIGLSKRTNEKGIAFYKSIFKEMNVIPIIVSDGLHLKSFITQFGTIDEDFKCHLILSGCKQGKEIFQQISDSNTNGSYLPHFTNEERASNCLLLREKETNNFTIIKKDKLDPRDEEIYENTIKLFKGKGKIISIEFDELYKIDGCVTCCSVLIDF